MQYLRALCPELPIPREPPGFHIATCGLPPPAGRRQLLSMLPTDVAIGRTDDVNEKAGVSLLVSETDARSVGFDLLGRGDGRIPYHYDVVRLHKPIRLMPIPPALHWNLKMPTNVPVDDGGNLIVSISVVHRCHCTTACHNVVDCFQACTAHAASGTDISLQDVVLVVPSPKSLVLSSHHQSLSRTRKVRSLQPTKGFFPINRRMLSETAILRCIGFRLHDRTRRELLHMRKCFASI